MFNIKCLFGKHKPLLLETLNKESLIRIYESATLSYENKYAVKAQTTIPLIDIQMCKNCKLLYWEISK